MVNLRPAHPSRETLSEYHDGELDAAERLEVRHHVLECVTCQEYLEDLRSGSSLYQRVPVARPPSSLRRDMYRRIDLADESRRRRAWLPLPQSGAFSAPNLAGLVVVTLLLAFLAPHVAGVWAALGATVGNAQQSAARPTLALQGTSEAPDAPAAPAAAPAAPAPGADTPPAPAPPAEPLPDAPLVEPRVTVVVPPSPVPPTPTATTAPARPSETARPQGASGVQAAPAPNAPNAPNVATGAPSPPAPAPTRTAPPATRSAPTQTVSPPPPTPTAAGPPQRQISGQISAVDRRQRLISVFSPDGNRTWQVRLADSTTLQQKDGRPLTFEDVGLADQVEVSGTEAAQGGAPVPTPSGVARSAAERLVASTPAGAPEAAAGAPQGTVQAPFLLTASSVRVLVSAVAAGGGAKGRILYLQDGVDGLRPPQYGYTGDWIKRLNDTGYAVTTLEPARISSGRYDLADVNLIVIGYPATLSSSALQLVTSSRKPVLNAEPRLVQALGLGLNVDPQQPARDAPGPSIEVAGQVSPVTGALKGETTLAAGSLHRMPIVASGAVLATVTEGGQKRAVWSASGTSMYFGFYASNAGQNHNATYWALFDRAVLWLLGRDPTPVAIPGT